MDPVPVSDEKSPSPNKYLQVLAQARSIKRTRQTLAEERREARPQTPPWMMAE